MEAINRLFEERDRIFERRTELLTKIKKTKDIPERDRLFKEYMDLGVRLQEVVEKLKMRTEKGAEAELWRDGVTIKTTSPYGNVFLSYEDMDRIVEWYVRVVWGLEGGKDGFVLVPEDVANELVWDHVWRVRCHNCGQVSDYDAVGFLRYLKDGKRCDTCGESTTTWELMVDGSAEQDV